MTTFKAAMILAWLLLGLASAMTGSYMLGGWGGLFLAFGIYVVFGLCYDAAVRNWPRARS